MRYNQDTIKKAHDALPSGVRATFEAIDLPDKSFFIGKKEGLHLDQIGKLAEEVDYLILGLTRREEFASVLARELGVDETKATAIARDVNEQILAEIRSALRERTDAPNATAPAVLEENRETTTNDRGPSSAPVSKDGPLNATEREAMLKELENPTATPISGRVVRPEIGDQAVNSKPETALAVLVNTPEPASPMNPVKGPIDPYREIF